MTRSSTHLGGRGRRADHLRQEPPGGRQHGQLRVPVLDAELNRGGHQLDGPAGGDLDPELGPEHHLAAAELGVPWSRSTSARPTPAGSGATAAFTWCAPEAPLRQERGDAAELFSLENGVGAHGR